ncbi:GNAT family N-acetyltransferase [Afifella pfennigii]|uniref:GNAT family N-acetyltransferase n=1 Tax=Afifella pfennigii TaxID=209897 RepID=UPI0006897A6C|nr:GNAT family N-acetyltransferase [Afifella pfennigii]
MIIRRAEPSDRARVAALQAQSWRDAYRGILPADYLAHRLDADIARHWRAVEIGDEDIVLVAEMDGELAGFISVWVRPTPFVDNLHVRPGLRSKGTGRRLMAEAARRLLEAGHASVYLWVVAGNEGAIRFYERLGGRRGELVEKDAFGNTTSCYRIAWDDLARLAGD